MGCILPQFLFFLIKQTKKSDSVFHSSFLSSSAKRLGGLLNLRFNQKDASKCIVPFSFLIYVFNIVTK